MKKENLSKIWNIIFSLVFILVFALFASMNSDIIESITLFEIVVITLATFRLIRLVVYDKIMKWLRDIFELDEPTGINQTLKDLTSCPWCFGVWATLIIFIIHFSIPGGSLFTLLLAISGVAAVIQITINLIGWNAQYKKIETQKLEK